MANTYARAVARLGFDPVDAACTACGVRRGKPCLFAPVRYPTDHVPLFHEVRVNAAEHLAGAAPRRPATRIYTKTRPVLAAA